MNAGTLSRRISIQTQSTTPDAFGQPVQVWTTAYQCWASIDVQSSQLIYSTAEFVSKVTHRITCRWTSSFVFQPNQQITYLDQSLGITHTYVIQAVINDNQANVSVTLLGYELNGEE